MPLYISITPKGDANTLINSLRTSIRLRADKYWRVNDAGDFERILEPDDARKGQAFHPVIDTNQRLRLVFTNEGVYDPSDYAEYYGEFVRLLIKEERDKFSIIRVMFDDENELDVKRPSIEDKMLIPAPTREIKSALTNPALSEKERIAKALELVNLVLREDDEEN